MTLQEFWEGRRRALGREAGGFADNNGAPWHTVSCVCRQCLDMDSMAITPWGRQIRAEALFSSRTSNGPLADPAGVGA